MVILERYYKKVLTNTFTFREVWGHVSYSIKRRRNGWGKTPTIFTGAFKTVCTWWGILNKAATPGRLHIHWWHSGHRTRRDPPSLESYHPWKESLSSWGTSSSGYIRHTGILEHPPAEDEGSYQKSYAEAANRQSLTHRSCAKMWFSASGTPSSERIVSKKRQLVCQKIQIRKWIKIFS